MRRRFVEMERDYDRLLAMHQYSWKINFPLHSFSEASFRESLRDGISRGEVYGYEQEGELVGWLWLDLTMPEVGAHIRHLQVAQSHWGKGFGRQMVLDALGMAQAQHCPLITLNVTKANERAMHLYRSLGFVVEQDSGARQRMVLAFSDKAG